MEPSGGGDRYPCSCFSCTDGGRRGPSTVSRSTWFKHNAAEKRRRLSQGRSGGGTAGCEPNAMPESISAGGPSDMGAPAASVSNAGVEAAAARDPGGSGRRCDADATPEQSETSSSDSSSEEDPEDVPLPEFLQESTPEAHIEPSPSPIYQPEVSTNEVRLPVAEFRDRRADLALYAYTVQHNLTQAAVADLLKLSTSGAKYRTPYLMERFIDESVNLETRSVDCCINGCLAFTHKRTRQTACDACGSPRYKKNGAPAKQVTYWSIVSWLAYLLGHPVIGKSMLANMAAALRAADEGADGVHDYYHSDNFRYLRARGVLRGIFVPMNLGTDGFQFWRQNGFEGWPITITPLSLSPDERARNKYQLLVAVTPGPKQPVDLESFLHPIMDELNELAKGIPGLRVAGLTSPQVLRAGILNFTTDQPGGDKLYNAKGVNSYVYNRLRKFPGVYFASGNHIYYPPNDPTPGRGNKTLFSVHNSTAPRRTAASIAADAAAVENARAEGKSIAYQHRAENRHQGLLSLFCAESCDAIGVPPPQGYVGDGAYCGAVRHDAPHPAKRRTAYVEAVRRLEAGQ